MIKQAVLLISLFTFTLSANAQSLNTDKQFYIPGEQILVHFSASAGFADNAWIGIIPSQVPHGSESVNDQHDLTYQYLHKRTSGTLVFTAPAQIGAFDFRLNDSDDNGREIASVTFNVVQSAAQPLTSVPSESSISLEKFEFNPGENIQVHFTTPAGFADNAWIGIIPSQVPHGSESVNDQHDLTYQYLLKRTSGTLVFTAPAQIGAFDFRLNDSDNNGREAASVSFKVSTSPGSAPVSALKGPSIILNKHAFRSGEQIVLNFTASPDFQANAWIGIVPSSITHGSEAVNDQHDLTYQYLQNQVVGTLVFVAPDQPGAYDFRMNDSDNNGREVASVSFEVNQ